MPQMIKLTTLATETRQSIKRQKTFFNGIFLKIEAALTPIMKINANFPHKKPLVTKTYSPLKGKKHMKKYEYFIENHKTTCVRTFI